MQAHYTKRGKNQYFFQTHTKHSEIRYILNTDTVEMKDVPYVYTLLPQRKKIHFFTLMQ